MRLTNGTMMLMMSVEEREMMETTRYGTCPCGRHVVEYAEGSAEECDEQGRSLSTGWVLDDGSATCSWCDAACENESLEAAESGAGVERYMSDRYDSMYGEELLS